jgi:hypothetical protein
MPCESQFDRCVSGAEITLPERAIVESVAGKVLENIERTEHLVSLVPANRLEWRPDFASNLPEVSDLGHVLGHLLDCLSGFCAAFYAAFPVELADFVELRSIAVNQSYAPEEARGKMRVYAAHMERGFQRCTDVDLARRIQTVFAPEGETLLAILLGNLEHLINHKYQLFLYLKLSGARVTSQDIYRWRGTPETGSS